ncbi:MAG: pre-peptidase C-terminal domain-containing protein [Anaerolineae bacterium]|nr:pre-peptidase C-terminal domain-containing protein [Anaerolineae bacterium]
MRRIFVLLLILFLGLTAVVVMAQDAPPPDDPTPVPTVLPDDPIDDPINSNYFMNLGGGPLSIEVGEGSDFCDTATAVVSTPSSNQMNVAAMTQSVTDPILNCMWGSPSNLKGYRTVWYKFTPNFNAVMTLSTLPGSFQAANAYDTVLAVHTGLCNNLTTLACNDDAVGFSSALTMNVRRNTTYYIEVADWQAGGNAVKTLDISLKIDPANSLWKTVATSPPNFTPPVRHASVVIGSNVYFLGGRNGAGDLLNNFQKLNTSTNTWSQLTPIRGGGFLNTTAVYLPDTNRIYIPGGSKQSNDQSYSRSHMFYNFGTGIWSSENELAPVGGNLVTEAFAYAAAAPNNAAVGLSGGADGYFLTGGVVGPSLVVSSTVRDQVLFYQPDTWLEVAPMSSPRYGHVAANVNGKLCVAGGLNTNGSSIVLIPNGECASGVLPSAWSPTGVMQVPRYFAHSSVAPDGKWYVYGGIDATGLAVPEVEYYDPETNQWSILGLSYDLFGQSSGQRGLVWPGGGFVGNYLWAAGGSYDPASTQLNPIVKKVQILGGALYLPIVLNTNTTSNHSFVDALSLPLGKTVSQNFVNASTLVNVYKFNVTQVSTINVALTNVASTVNLNLYLYGDNKDLIQSNDLPFFGVNKTFSVPLGPGTYYVVVRFNQSFNFPNDLSNYYQLRVYK